MGGERLHRVHVGRHGLVGDRAYGVVSVEEGENLRPGVGRRPRPLSAREEPALLRYTAWYGPAAAACQASEALPPPQVQPPGGNPVAWDDGRLAWRLSEETGQRLRLVRLDEPAHEVAAVHLITQQTLRTLSRALGRPLAAPRSRANVVIQALAEEPFPETAWVGRLVYLGPQVAVRVTALCRQYALLAADPDTGRPERELVDALRELQEPPLGVYARVVRTGWLFAGDVVALVPRAPGAEAAHR